MLLIIGGIMIYVNSTVTLCKGWNIINPLCWGGSLLTHSVLLFGGIALIGSGVLKLIFYKNEK
jgi:hypothetical protein